MPRLNIGKSLALSLGVSLLSSCGVAPLAHFAAPNTHIGAKSTSWPPVSLTATVETISGGHSHADVGNVANVPAAQARYNLPNGIAFFNDLLYVSDARNNVITVLSNQNGTLFASEFAGSSDA